MLNGILLWTCILATERFRSRRKTKIRHSSDVIHDVVVDYPKLRLVELVDRARHAPLSRSSQKGSRIAQIWNSRDLYPIIAEVP